MRGWRNCQRSRRVKPAEASISRNENRHFTPKTPRHLSTKNSLDGYTLVAHQLHVLLSAGDPEAVPAALPWRAVGPAD
jgi:hypothetical protein